MDKNESTQEFQPAPLTPTFRPIDAGQNGNVIVIVADRIPRKNVDVAATVQTSGARIGIYRRPNGKLFARYETLGVHRWTVGGKTKTERVWGPDLIPQEDFAWVSQAMARVVLDLAGVGEETKDSAEDETVNVK